MSGDHRMNVESLITLLLGGGIVSSIFAWISTRHRPKIDQAKLVMDGQQGFIDDLRGERDRLDDRVTAQADRIDNLLTRMADTEDTAKQAASHAHAADERATAMETAATLAKEAAEALALAVDVVTAHMIDLRDGVETHRYPPWPPVPPGQNWIADEDFTTPIALPALPPTEPTPKKE